MTAILACFLALACRGGAASVADSGPTVTSVRLRPVSINLEEGTGGKVELTVTGSNGSTLSRAGNWTVGDTAVALLTGSGSSRTVEALQAGSTRIVASVEGVADTADVDVAPSGGAAPVAVFNPDAFATSEELHNDDAEYLGDTSNIYLDTAVARPGGSSSMRYDYVDQGIGNSISLGRSLDFPNDNIKELWVEAQIRWSKNFFDIQSFPDGETFAHKLMFGGSRAFATSPSWETSEGWGVGRWAFKVPGGGSGNPPNGRIGMETPVHGDGASNMDKTWVDGVNVADALFDAEWHTVRLHWRHDPGLYWLEFDGTVVAEVTGFTVHPEVEIVRLFLGRNKDDGIESGTESLWWGKVQVWTRHPGW